MNFIPAEVTMQQRVNPDSKLMEYRWSDQPNETFTSLEEMERATRRPTRTESKLEFFTRVADSINTP